MNGYSRGEFLGMGAFLVGGLGVGRLPVGSGGSAESVGAEGPGADLVLLNARVYTVDERRARVEAFAVKHGRFIAVGTTAEMRALATRDTEVLDAGGRTVTPGFIDAHTHPSGVGLAHLTQVNTDLGSIAKIQAALRGRAAQTPAGQWVIGFMYDDTKLAEGRPLTRRDLDAAAPNHPVAVEHRGGHTSVYNSAAFARAGITAATPDPEGGHIYKENGELTGKVAERANAALERMMPSGSTREQRRAGVKLISELMSAAGLTSVHQTHGGANDLIAYQDAHAAGELRLRVYFFPSGGGDLYRSLRAAGVRTGFGDEWLRIGAVKFGVDGSASERTMRMSTPYVGRPNDFGILTMTQAQVDQAVEEAHRAGWQIGIHANGDVAIGMVLDAYERAQRLLARPDARHRIEHATLVNPELLRRMKQLAVIPTPFYTYVHYHGEKWAEYGEEKARWMFPHRSYLDHGIPAAGASDHQPGPFEPMMAIQSMVTRKDYRGRVWGENQRISVDEALRVGTINGAYASFEEGLKGSITEGKLADFVVLDQDPHEVDPDRIKYIPVARTVIDGKTVHPVRSA